MDTLNRNRLTRKLRLASALIVASMLTACFGDHEAGSKFSSQVTFGDSLSDVGTYAVGAVLAANGGKYTVNSIPRSPQIWTELIATQLGLPLPCAAQTGLDGDAAQGYNVPTAFFANCTNYSQGGARVTDPIGPQHKSVNPILGQLTVPVVTQIQNHLAKTGGRFNGSEIVFVDAGGNDFLWQSDALTAAVIAALPGQIAKDIASGACVPTDATGSNCVAGAIANALAALAPTYISAMEVAGTELAALVTNEIVGKGAKYVVVINLVDAGKTPSAKGQPANVLAIISQMVSAFNAKLTQGLGSNNSDKILVVDMFSRFGLWAANPASFGFSNFTDTACNLTQPSPNPLGSSLVCTTSNVIAGDVSRYAFADTVHPSPYTHSLVAEFVRTEMSKRGWW